MKATKIKISNLFGIKEMDLDGKSIELSGTNGAGKTSVIDAIRYALTNNSERDYIIKKGELEGEITVETDTGLVINRKKRSQQSDYKSVKENGDNVARPESFLQDIFTELQLNPVEFTQMSRQEQNRRVLDLIDFAWDLNWIREQFGEIPSVNYEQNILKVLHDIQDKNGVYFLDRENVNRDIRNKKAFIADIAKDIPDGYDYSKWDKYDIDTLYEQLNTIRKENAKIEKSKAFKEAYDNKLRGLEADREIALNVVIKTMSDTKLKLTSNIERLKAELKAEQDSLDSLAAIQYDKEKIVESEHKERVSKLNSDNGVAATYAGRETESTTSLENIIDTAKKMKAHLNEYKRMNDMQVELSSLESKSAGLTDKIELARELPSQILKTATIPIEGLTILDGIPLINDLPVSNLSEGEKLRLCVEIAISNPNSLQIILLDGTEKLSDENREALYKACMDKGLQYIATRTTNSNELIITTLDEQSDDAEEMLGGALNE